MFHNIHIIKRSSIKIGSAQLTVRELFFEYPFKRFKLQWKFIIFLTNYMNKSVSYLDEVLLYISLKRFQ